jgi:hypothetical protein
MKTVLKIVSYVGLVLTVVPAFAVMAGAISWETHALLMFIGMVVWFCSAPFWMRRAT